MRPASRAARTSPYLGVILFAAVFFAPELFGGRIAATANMARWRPWSEFATTEERLAVSHNPDCNLSYYPRRALLHESWRSGEVPLWNPYSFCGTPFLADVQAGVLYPVNWLLLPLEPGRQLGLFLFLHVAWGGIGVLLLLRGMGIPTSIAALAGCAFAVNGYFAKHFGQPTFLATASWVPWVILAARIAWKRPSASGAARLALAGAGLFLAGQPQTAIHAAYAVIVVIAVGWLASAQGGRPSSWWRSTAGLVAAGGLAALLVAVQLLPTFELASRSARAALPYSTVVSGAFHPVDVIRFLVPEFFGSPITSDEWSPLFPRGDGFYSRNQLNSIYAGTPVFLLAMWGALSSRTRRAALPFTALFLLAVLVAFGTPLARLAYEILPGFRFSRIDRIGVFVVFAQVPLAALGAGELARSAGRGRRVFGALVLAVAAGVFVVVPRLAPSMPEILGANPALVSASGFDGLAEAVITRTRTAMLFAAGASLAFLVPAGRLAAHWPLALAAVQLFLFASAYRGDRHPREVFARTPDIEKLAGVLETPGGGGRFVRFGRDLPVRPYPLSSVLPPSTNVPFLLRDLQGYNALADRALGETLEVALGENLFSHGIWTGRRIVAPTRNSALEHPLLDALSVRAAVSAGSLEAQGWTFVSREGFGIWRNEEALPRAHLVSRGFGVSEERMVRALRGGEIRPRDEVLWIGEGALEGPPSGEIARGLVEISDEGANHLEVRVRTEEKAVLVVTDAHSPGWRATVDGVSTTIVPVWGLVRGVLVPAGDHVVRMEYRPESLARGTALSVIGLLAVGFVLALANPARRSSPGTL